MDRHASKCMLVLPVFMLRRCIKFEVHKLPLLLDMAHVSALIGLVTLTFDLLTSKSWYGSSVSCTYSCHLRASSVHCFRLRSRPGTTDRWRPSILNAYQLGDIIRNSYLHFTLTILSRSCFSVTALWLSTCTCMTRATDLMKAHYVDQKLSCCFQICNRVTTFKLWPEPTTATLLTQWPSCPTLDWNVITPSLDT